MEGSSGRTMGLQDGRQLGYAEWGSPAGHPLFYFHGWPGSRLEARLADAAAHAAGVRLIAVDRPGMGLSDHQPRRRLVDWPDDVLHLAAALDVDRFSVLGISGGGPFAAVCAWRLSQRLTRAGIVSCLAPLNAQGAVTGMGLRNRLSLNLVGRVSIARRALFAVMTRSARRQPEQVLEQGLAAPVDKAYLARPEVRNTLTESLIEAFRNGGRGPAADMRIYARPWGFPLEDIRTPVYLSHGEDDANAPITMGRYLASVIPDCQATFYPGEGHLHFVDRLPQILAAVCPGSSD